ncbi:Type 2A phosphatase activator TIP41 [Neolecta irregularis DAH-3]|uniref:Type 2A phosphatase activator TIP41 n=1 Tax=Neolecta irregularis (strain DAH-3) TaxID=1198029 RepID=A0A1U7LIG5_NEOID|nr:Type 2A phosphatase activator TIP41 [Neolecta irregularis DAH-3]|eukprot:OLL22450.1 Type 2A phosphatase activator TIP41 [Neolecta irregularis DAH-3]
MTSQTSLDIDVQQFSHPIPHTISTTRNLKKIELHSWTIEARKNPICSSKEIDTATTRLGIPVPEMIFGNNMVRITHKNGWEIKFTALDALDLVDKTDSKMLKVHYSEVLLFVEVYLPYHCRNGINVEKASEDIKEIVKPFDWTYSTEYSGTLNGVLNRTDESIPLVRLRRPDPILLYDEVVLYEDELADNGTALLSVKVRVMPARLLLLSRFYMRLDDVIFRIRDTRIFVEFSTNEVIREYVEKEDIYEDVKRKVPPGRDTGAFFRDPQWVSENLSVVKERNESNRLEYAL